MEVSFREADHTYWTDQGRQLPSVSSILKPISSAQYAGVDEARMRAAAERGTKVDRIVQEAVAGTFDPEQHDFELLPYYDAWQRFVAGTGFEVVECQGLVWSVVYGYAGQLDLIGRFPGKPGLDLIDVKNTFAIMPSARPQTAGYELAFRESRGVPPADPIRRHVLHFKNGKCTLNPLPSKADHKVFMAALTTHKFIRGEL